jgi:hypothetical protein
MEADGFEDGFSSQKLTPGPGYSRRIVCRYGRGCTHKADPSHRDRFWHPDVPDLSSEQIRTHYICYECAESFVNLVDLQVSYCICIYNPTLNFRLISCPFVAPSVHENCLVRLDPHWLPYQLPHRSKGVARRHRDTIS